MVATRRAAQPAVEDELAMEDPELALKKKPVRKATAKTSKSAPKTETKAKTTRSKKAEPEIEVQEEESEPPKPAKTAKKAAGRPRKEAPSEPVVEKAPEPSKPTRGTKAASVRGKKAVAIVEEPEVVPAEAAPKPTRATKTAALRGRKAAVAIDSEPEQSAAEVEPKPMRAGKTGSVRGRKAAAIVEDAPALPAPEEPKQTRSTRTTAAKAAPLSPKKITQVSKPATRTTRTTNSKAAPKTAPAKAPAKGRSAARKRTESNENADPEADDDVEVDSTTPVKPKATRARAKKEEPVNESEVSMSSRPTTPNGSAAQSFSQNDDDVDELQKDNESVAEDSGAVEGAVEASDDELCGPKTPMKRSSPGATARYYESVQRTIRKYEEKAQKETPARRFAALGSQRGTPQTQKPYCKPAPPSSVTRPMTVSRGADRAFVFRDLREGAPSLPEHLVAEEEQDELSFIPDDDIIPMDHEEDVPPTPTPADHDTIQLDLQAESDVEMKDDFEEASDLHAPEDDEAYVIPSLVEPDPEETMIIHDVRSAPFARDAPPIESFDMEDTVLINRPEQESQNEEMVEDASDVASTDGSVIHHVSRAPSASISKSSEISVDFDNHFMDARVSPQKAPAAMHVPSESPAPESTDEGDVDAGAGAEDNMKIDAEEPIGEFVEGQTDESVQGPVQEPVQEQIEHPIPELPSRRETVNLSEFIDMTALSEATLMIDDAQADVNTVEPKDDDVNSFLNEEEPTVEEAVLGERTPEEQAQPIKDLLEPEEIAAPQAEAEPAVENDNDLDIEHPEPDAQEAEVTGLVNAEAVEERDVPHYALPTIAFDARRKSMPVIGLRTPVKVGGRPITSDGASIPRIANPFATAWWSRQRTGSTAATPVKSRPSTANAALSTSNFGTPAKSSKAATPVAMPGERFPRLAPQINYEDHAKTVAPVRFSTPAKQSPKRRETFHRAMPGQAKPAPVAATPSPAPSPSKTPQPTRQATSQGTPGERYPRLRPRVDYEDHSKTVAAPVRFKTPPSRSPVKRPATSQKPGSIRKAALAAKTNRTPMKTPLKGPAMTPGQEPMTPHPAVPLRTVVAMVEVYTLEGASASAPFVTLLHRLGAKTTRTWSDKVTHVIFKDGSPTTLQRVRLHNKAVSESGNGTHIRCVNSRWVTDCDTDGTHKDESDEEYIVDIAEVPRGGKRRRKSMEPSALLNIGGNIVRDRKCSLGRASIGRTSSFGRSPMKMDFPAKKPESPLPETPNIDVAEKENSGDDQGSPATPAWIAEPRNLIQQTAPMNRVRKLEIQGGKEPKSRRLTFWSGGA